MEDGTGDGSGVYVSEAVEANYYGLEFSQYAIGETVIYKKKFKCNSTYDIDSPIFLWKRKGYATDNILLVLHHKPRSTTKL